MRKNDNRNVSSILDNYPAVRYVDEYDRDKDPQCIRCKGNCGLIGMTGMWACQGFIPKTNYDRVVSMIPEELAEFIQWVRWNLCPPKGVGYSNGPDEICNHPCGEDAPKAACVECWLAWLRKDVE